MRVATMFGLALAVALIPGCKKKRSTADDIPLAEAQARATKFEPVLAIVKTLPKVPPPVTKPFVPPGTSLSTTAAPGQPRNPEEFLVIHAEDLAVPGYWSNEAVKGRIEGTGVLSGCASGLAEVKAAKEPTVYKTTLLACTKLKYAFVIRTTDYRAPDTTRASDTTAGNKRTIVDNVVAGHINADVTIYDLADGKPVGGFQYRAVSSDLPSTEGGFVGALDRDLAKQANVAIMDAYLAAPKAGAAAVPVVKPVKKK